MTVKSYSSQPLIQFLLKKTELWIRIWKTSIKFRKWKRNKSEYLALRLIYGFVLYVEFGVTEKWLISIRTVSYNAFFIIFVFSFVYFKCLNVYAFVFESNISRSYKIFLFILRSSILKLSHYNFFFYIEKYYEWNSNASRMSTPRSKY